MGKAREILLTERRNTEINEHPFINEVLREEAEGIRGESRGKGR